MIKVIVFDMGQVLIEFDPYKFVKTLGYTDERVNDYLMNHIFCSKTWRDMDSGTISSENGYAHIIETIDEKYKKDAQLLTSTWWSIAKPIEGMIDLVNEIKEKGYKLYLLSNASDNHAYYWNKLPYEKFFDGLYVSAFHKKIKPNKEIYEDFLNEFQLSRNECLFIDDTKKNVDAAIECGIQSHQFIDANELLVYLKDNSIL